VRLGDPKRRVRASIVLVAFVLSLFAGRLFQLQGIDASAYASVGEKERLRSATLLASRGTITDAHGVALAASVPGVAVTADPSMLPNAYATAAVLAPRLHVDEQALARRLSVTGTRFAYVARGVPLATWHEVQALGLVGVFSQVESKRVYPTGRVGSNLVGFVGIDGHGLAGMEQALDPQLAGHDGALTYQAGADGQEIPTAGSQETVAVPGQDVQLTIDRDIQYVAQKAIMAKVKEAKAESGTVVVEDTRTGRILAMATTPTVDPADPGAAKARDRGNRAFTEAYEPGSIAKALTAAAVVDQGKANPRTKVVVPGVLHRGGHAIHDDVPHGTWHLTFAGVIAKSSNIGMMKLFDRIGKNTLYDYERKFGIGSTTGINFPGETAGLLATPEQQSVAQSNTMAFGQGFAVNSVQVASAYATIANGGVRVAPSIVAGSTGSDGVFHAAPAPAQTRVVSESTAHAVTGMLEQVLGDGGTAPMARIAGYRVAGKTGTANRVDPSCGCYRGYTASFAGFAPADAPRIAVSVTLQDPRRGHFGGMLGGPVFKQVMSFALQSMKVPPTGTRPPIMRLEWKHRR